MVKRTTNAASEFTFTKRKLCSKKVGAREARAREAQRQQRQFIEEQLAAVREQREQLRAQQGRAGGGLHELSTIKEVDTPKSERNLKLAGHVKDEALFDVHEVSSHLDSRDGYAAFFGREEDKAWSGSELK